MNQIESSEAEHHPEGRTLALAVRATLTSAAEPKGAFMLFETLSEDRAPAELDRTIVNSRASVLWDYTDNVQVREFDDPPSCVLGPHYNRREL